MTEPTATPEPAWLDLAPSALAALRQRLIAESAATLNRIAEIDTALASCRRYPEAATAGDACRLACLAAVTRHSA